MKFIDFLFLGFIINNEMFYTTITKQDLKNGYVNIYAEDSGRHNVYKIATMPIDSSVSILKRTLIEFSDEYTNLTWNELQKLWDKYPELKNKIIKE